MYVVMFTSTCGHVDGDEMFLSWVGRAETFVLCERNKRSLPRNRL